MNYIIIFFLMLLLLAASQVQLYVDSINGVDPIDCNQDLPTLCTITSPCKTLSCSFEYANITLQKNNHQDLIITLNTALNPNENNYTLAEAGQNKTFWINFDGLFTLTGNLSLQPTTQTCSKYPVLSLQNYMNEHLYINATSGTIFQYLNFQILLAIEPIKIYNYGFIMQNVCIGINKTSTLGLLPDYQKAEENEEEFSEYSPYINPKYKMMVLESGGINTSTSTSNNLTYKFTNMIITYNGTEFKYCGAPDNTNMLIAFPLCNYYYLSGIIRHKGIDNTILPRINFINIEIECLYKKFIKIFHSDYSQQFTINGMISNGYPLFELATNNVDINSITLDNNAFKNNNQITNTNSKIMNNGALVFDLTTKGAVSIQNFIMTNFELGICNDYESCYDTTPDEPNSIIAISDRNSYLSSSRLLEQSNSNMHIKEYPSDKWSSASGKSNEDHKWSWIDDSSSRIKSFTYELTDYHDDDSDNYDYDYYMLNTQDELDDFRIDQESNDSESIIPPISIPDLSKYSNITRDSTTVLNPDYTSYIVHQNRPWPNLQNSIDLNNAIMFKNITITNNILSINKIDNFFSFIYVNSIELSKTQGYIIQDIIFTNNTGNDTYQHYAFTLYDATSYYINNITYTQNKVSRLIYMGIYIRQINISVVITNINISNNNYSMLNDKSTINDPNTIDNPTMGIIDVNSNNMTSSVALSNITFANNILNFTRILSIKNNYISYEFISAYSFISNLLSINNSLTGSSFLTFTGSNLYINNATIMNQILKSSSVFDLSNQENQFNSFVLQNSTFINNSLLLSYMIQKNADLNSAFAYLETQTKMIVLPFWITISNCTFTMIKLKNSSAILQFTSMPFIFVFNNTFTDIYIAQTSTLIEGNDFVDPIKNIPGITKGITYLIDNLMMLGQFTSQIFQSSIQLLLNNNPYSDLRLVNSTNQLLTAAFITRVAFNTFDRIFTNLSIVMQFQVCQTNIMLFSIDHNIIINTNISNYLDAFARFDSIAVIGLALNNFVNMSGKGYIIKISDHSNLKIYNNYLLNNTGSSFMRISSTNPIQTIISTNTIYNISSGYAFIILAIQYNNYLISFVNNIFYNCYLKADITTYQTFNLIYMQVSASNLTTGFFRFDNNSFINIQFIKNHALIKQFYNSLIFLSNPDTVLQFKDSLLYNISILYDDNLLSIMTDKCNFYNNSLTLVHNYDKTGSLYFLGQALNVTYCEFQYNFAYNGYGGAIFVDYDEIDYSNTTVFLKSNSFRNNFALIGSAFYYAGATITFKAQYNHFYKGEITTFDKEYGITNAPAVLGTVGFAQAIIKESLIFNSNTLYSVGDKHQYAFLNFIDVTSSTPNATINFSSFYVFTNNDSFLAVRISNSSGVNFILDNITINVGAINYLPIALLSADSGNITISNFNIGLLGGYTPFIQILCNSQTNTSLSIINSTMSNFFVPILSSSFGIIHISDGGSSHSCYQTLNISNTTIQKAAAAVIADWTQDFSAIYVDYPGNLNISISKSKFQFIDSVRGPAINLNNWPIPPNANSSAMNSSASSNTTKSITKSFNLQNYTNSALQTIIQNTYYNYYVYINISDSEFTNNSAYLEGGAIYNTYNNLSIQNSNFSYNQAQYRTGAAIFSMDGPSLAIIKNPLNNNTFLSNQRYSQKYYGLYSDNAPLGSPPVLMNLTITQSPDSYANIINYTSNNSFMITNVSTHDLGAITIIVGLIDYLGQIFYESQNGDTELDPTLTNIRMIKIITKGSTSSSSNCDFINCYISNTTLILKGLAGTFLPITITYQSDENTVPNLPINSIIRNCMVGEINSSKVQGGQPSQSICTLCPIDSYSLNLNDSSCTECDFGDAANCMGGSYIFVNPGYWRENDLSKVILQCPNQLACQGGFDSECTYGYVGPLCQSCNITANFARSGRNECGICPSKLQQILVALAYLVFIIVYQIYMIRSNLLENLAFYNVGITSEGEKAKTQGQYVRLLTTYTQIVSIVLTFQLDYPSFLQESLGPATSSPTNSIFASTMCFLIDLGYDTETISFYKIGLISAIPFIKIIAISFILFIILHTCKKGLDPTLKKAFYLITIFCVSIVDQPGVVNQLVGYLTCIQINNQGLYYLLSDYGVKCYTSNYNYYLLLIVLPSILIWSFLIPCSLFIILFKNRKKLSNKLLRFNLGGIYNEYTDKAYYWGIVLMLMKLFLMFSTAVLYNDTKTEAMTVIVILSIYLIAHGFIKPIKQLEIDKAEQMATSSYIVTIFFALYYKNNRYAICEILAIIIIAAVNFFVIGYLIYKIIILNLKTIPFFRKNLFFRRITLLLINEKIDPKKNEQLGTNTDDKFDEIKKLKKEEKNDHEGEFNNELDVQIRKGQNHTKNDLSEEEEADENEERQEKQKKEEGQNDENYNEDQQFEQIINPLTESPFSIDLEIASERLDTSNCFEEKIHAH